MRLVAPAKINLHLRIGRPRPDGFHPLVSWFCTVGLFDTLTLNAAPVGEAGRGVFTLRTDHALLPTDERNLVVQVARAFADTRGGDATPAGSRERVSAFLEKRIPIGGGLGGGSSDAASALLGLNQIWRMGMSATELARFSANFGSDLPFFFFPPSSICTGRGEIVQPIPRPKPRSAVLILPGIELPTSVVYRRFDEMRLGEDLMAAGSVDWPQWCQLDARELLHRLVNDLEPPAFALNPELAQLRERVEQVLRRPVRMSGSGSTLFTLYDDPTEAQHAAPLVKAMTTVDAIEVDLAPAKFD